MPEDGVTVACVPGPWKGGPFVLKRATVSDRDIILGIDYKGGAYDDVEFLPAKLGRYLIDPNRVCYLGEIDGKPVTFVMFRALDGGKVVSVSLARVDYAWRKSGLVTMQQYYSIQDAVTNLYPQMAYFQGCTRDYKMLHSLTYRNVEAPRWNLILNRAQTTIMIPENKTIATRPSVDSMIKSSEMSIESCHKFFSRREDNFRLFPSSTAVICREPVQICKANLAAITEQCVSIYSSFSQATTEYTTVSFGNTYEAPQGHIYDLDIYSISDDGEELLNHLSHHVNIARKYYAKDRINLVLYVHPLGIYETLRGALNRTCEDIEMSPIFTNYSTSAVDPHQHLKALKAKL